MAFVFWGLAAYAFVPAHAAGMVDLCAVGLAAHAFVTTHAAGMMDLCAVGCIFNSLEHIAFLQLYLC